MPTNAGLVTSVHMFMLLVVVVWGRGKVAGVHAAWGWVRLCWQQCHGRVHTHVCTSREEEVRPTFTHVHQQNNGGFGCGQVCVG